MEIIYDPVFTKKPERQILYIANDKPKAAIKFKKDIISKIKAIAKNSKIYRKSIFFNDEEIRDLIFKGYTITFKITKSEVIVFGFIKWEEDY
jgi:plasmid stabilization system protein ParE